MKARINDCVSCRKKMHEDFLKHEYKFFSDTAYSMAVYAICGVLSAMVRKGRTKMKLKDLAELLCIVICAFIIGTIVYYL